MSGRTNESLSTPDDNDKIQNWDVLNSYKTSLSAVIAGDVNPICLKSRQIKRSEGNGVVQNFFGKGGRYYSKVTKTGYGNKNSPRILEIYAKGKSLNDFSKLTPTQKKEAYKQFMYFAGGTVIGAGTFIVIAESWPALMVAAGTPQGQILLRESVHFMRGMVPSTSPSMTKGGVIGFAVGQSKTINDYFHDK